jgi:hypothetical protein
MSSLEFRVWYVGMFDKAIGKGLLLGGYNTPCFFKSLMIIVFDYKPLMNSYCFGLNAGSSICCFLRRDNAGNSNLAKNSNTGISYNFPQCF